jgi:hypothetical protein
MKTTRIFRASDWVLYQTMAYWVIGLQLLPAVAAWGAVEAPSTFPPQSATATPLPPANVTGRIALDGQWRLALDPKNAGRTERWWENPVAEAKPARVPGIIQEVFPGAHGVAWYWRDFTAPSQLPPEGRCLLRFWGADCQAVVWLNGRLVGEHEGGETPFTLDVTDTLKPGAGNRLAVRIINPTHEPIDGLVLNQTPRQARVLPYSAGAAYDCGGITDTVELLLTPAVRIEDIFARANPTNGIVLIQASVHNAGRAAARGRLEVALAPAAGGETLAAVVIERELPPGDTLVEARLPVAQPHLWDLNDPYLYRATARVSADGPPAWDENSVRFSFRDFRFERGYFRLNGRRLFLRSSHTCNHFPIGQRLPHDPGLARKDLLDVKTMGFNTLRFIWGGALRYQLDLCDELGLLVYEESFASSPLDPSPQLAQRFDRSVAELIRRDRNHPSVVIWGLLNEAPDAPAFRHATTMLPLVRSLDPTRLVLLNAGRYDGLATATAGPFSRVDWWHGPAGREPWIVYNPLPDPLPTPFGFAWIPHRVCLHPGEKGEYSVARWIAPRSGRATVTATFTGLPQSPATTDTHVLHNGKSLFSSCINLNGRPNTANYSASLAVAEGDTLDFAVGFGNGSYGSDTTALEASIQMESGLLYRLADGFSKEHNPAGPWVYGTFQPGPGPESASFARYTEPGKQATFGSLANPGSVQWEDLLTDQHHYPRVPHTAAILQTLRQQASHRPIFLSEYGIGSAVDLWRATRHFERLGLDNLEDALFYRDKLNRFLADWEHWRLGELYARPQDFFAESLRKMAGQRTLGLDAIRANPHYVGYSLTGMNDHVSCGEGLTTTFRELKPGTVDALFEGLAPLRLCLFAEPAFTYRGGRVKLEAVLANEDALAPGTYPVRLQVIGPDHQRQFERTVPLVIREVQPGSEPPFALPVATEEILMNGPSGRYQFLANFEKGAAPTGGEAEFYVAGPDHQPKIESEVVLWGKAPELAKWLSQQSVKIRPFSLDRRPAREVLLVGTVPEPGGAEAFRELARRVAQGSTVIFLSPKVFQKGNQPLGWLPLANKGAVTSIYSWLYLKDEWAKTHPIFEHLPAGGLLDYTVYREIIPELVWTGQDPPAEAVAGAIKASQDYSSGLLLSVYRLGAGRFILNTFLIEENLGQHPAAGQLLNNLIRFAAHGQEQSPAEMPAGFEAQLKTFGY